MTQDILYYLPNDGFYETEQPGSVPVSAEDHEALMHAHYNEGKLIIADSNGNPILIDRPPSDYHEWDGSQWVLPEAGLQAVISAEKSAKLAEINRTAQALVSQLAQLNDTPEFERATWQEQAREALAWHADNHTATPTLAEIARNRGVPLDLLRQKAYEKTVQFRHLTNTVAGQRQALEDRLKAAQTLEQIAAINITFNLETFIDES